MIDVADALKPGAPQVWDEPAPGNICYDWHLGDQAAADAAFAKARARVVKLDLVNNRLVANAMEPRAAIGEYDRGTGEYTLYTTSQNPHVIRLLMGAFVLHIPEAKLRVVAPDVGGGFGSKIYHYAEEAIVTWAAGKLRRPVKWTAERVGELHVRRARPRPRHPCRAGARQRRQVPRRSRCRRSPIWAPISRPSRPASRPISTGRCSPAPTRRRRSMSRPRRSSPTPCRSTPIAAPGGRRRRSCWSASSTSPPTSWGSTRPNCAAATSSRPTPIPTRRRWRCNTTAATTSRRLDMALQGGRLRRLRGAAAGGGAARQAARHRHRHLYRGVRHRAVGGRRLVGRPRRALRIGGGAGPSDRQRHGAHRHAQPRPGARDDLRAARRGRARHPDRADRDRPRRHRQDPLRHGHLWLALARGRRLGDRQGDGQGRRQGPQDRRASARSRRGRHRVQGRQVHRRRHRPFEIASARSR